MMFSLERYIYSTLDTFEHFMVLQWDQQNNAHSSVGTKEMRKNNHTLL